MKTPKGKLGFGTARLPYERKRGGQASIDAAMLDGMVDAFMDGGFNWFDVAHTYCEGACEDAVRRSLVERHPRESFILTDKLPTMILQTEGDAERIFAGQLEACGVGYFDNYMVHCATAAFCEHAEKLHLFDFVERKKREGKVQATGFSYHDSPELLDWLLKMHPEIDFVQLQISYLDWEDSPIQARRCYETARRHGKPVVAMCPLKGGLLADVPRDVERMFREECPDSTPAEWAMRYVASLEGVVCVLSGMSSLEQVQTNCAFMRHIEPLNSVGHAIIDKAVRSICRNTPIQCTGCGYCLPVCPEKIGIPDLLSLYNKDVADNHAGSAARSMRYASVTEGGGKASDCTGCRRCEEACPQHIRIVDALQNVSSLFECECITP